MTKAEKEAIIVAAERIKHLASLENARFDIDDKRDKFIKDEVSSYMVWFENVADCLEKLAHAENSFDKKAVIERMVYHI